MEGLLWIALLLFIVASLISTKRSYFIGFAGWLFFAAHWASLPIYYIHISDFFNVILTILVAAFCAFCSVYHVVE